MAEEIIIATPAEMRRMASDLLRFNQDIESVVSCLTGQFQRLGDSWRDAEYQQFAEAFNQTTQQLRRFLKITEDYSRFLQRKAQAGEDYQRIHH